MRNVNWRTVVLSLAVLGLVLSLWALLQGPAKVPPRPTEATQAGGVQKAPTQGVNPTAEAVGPTEAQLAAAEAKAKAEAVAKQDERSKKAESERKLHPFLTLLLVVGPLTLLFGFRSTVERMLEEAAKKPRSMPRRRPRPEPDTEPEPAPAETEPEPAPAETAKEGGKSWPWLVNVIWAYDALIAAILVKGIVSPLLNRCAVGMGGWYAFSRGDFPGKVYYHDALAPWAPAFWLWLCLAVALVASCKSGQQKDQCDKRRYDRVSLLAIWGMIAIVCLVFVSFLGATIRWGKEHPKPEPPAVVAPAEPEQSGNPEKVDKAPAGANLPDLPARDLFGQRSFTFFPKEGDPTEAPKGGVFNP